ncbi:MAG: MBL fold metallo-hydrolase [Bacteroidota bacterium]
MSPINIQTFSSSDLGFFVISTIAYGEKEAVLFDAQLLQKEAQKVVEMIKELDKQLKAIFITHAHSDHFFGLATFQKAFPEVKIYAHPAVVADAQKTARHQVIAMKQLFKDLIPDTVVIPEPYTASTYSLEDQKIQIIPNLTGDIAPSTAYFIPTIEAMIAGDIVYNKIHPWTLDTDNKQRDQWITSLRQLKSYHPKIVIGGHKDISQPDSPDALDFMINYLTKFNEAINTLATAEAVIERMKQQFPTAGRVGMLKMGAKKNKGEDFSFQDFFEK